MPKKRKSHPPTQPTHQDYVKQHQDFKQWAKQQRIKDERREAAQWTSVGLGAAGLGASLLAGYAVYKTINSIAEGVSQFGTNVKEGFQDMANETVDAFQNPEKTLEPVARGETDLYGNYLQEDDDPRRIEPDPTPNVTESDFFDTSEPRTWSDWGASWFGY